MVEGRVAVGIEAVQDEGRLWGLDDRGAFPSGEDGAAGQWRRRGRGRGVVEDGLEDGEIFIEDCDEELFGSLYKLQEVGCDKRG